MFLSLLRRGTLTCQYVNGRAVRLNIFFFPVELLRLLHTQCNFPRTFSFTGLSRLFQWILFMSNRPEQEDVAKTENL